jgi:hypothetical protein
MARKKIPLLAFAALAGLAAAYLILWVEPRRDALVGLDFRRLAAMAERLDMQLATYRQVVANASSSPKPLLQLPPPLEARASQPPSGRAASVEQAVVIRDQITPGGRWFLFETPQLLAGVRIEEVIRQAVEPHTFDKLILATSDGSILYQEGRKELQLTTLRGIGIEEKTIQQISRSTGLYEATLSGRSYKVLVQPCASPRASRLADKDSPTGWVLLAFMGASRFHMRSLAVSANWIILILGVALLALLALPFLKLLTIGKGARLRAIDGLLAGLCSLIGLSVLTVLLLDAFVFRKLEALEDEQVRMLAGAIHRSFGDDLENALADLSELRRESAGLRQNAARHERVPEALEGHNSFFWADALGRQTFKWTQADQASQLIPVGERGYFREALAGRRSFSRDDSGDSRDYVLESSRSWTTGEDQVAIATLDRQGSARSVAVLTTRMTSVHDAVLPPGFGFAVIDSTGKVLFHSERRRMLQENFLEEAESERLRALAAAGRPGAEQVSYKGMKHRVYLEPIPELAWSVISFREMALLRATNVQIITTALVCLILYSALFLGLFSVVYMASSTRARWLWPMASRQGSYLQLAFFYLGCVLVHILLLMDANPLFLLVNGMLIPLLVLFVSYVKVRSEEKLDSKQVGALSAVAILLLVSLSVGLSGIDLSRRRLALIALILAGLFLFLPIVSRSFSRWRPAPLRATYLCTAALLLLVLTVLPAASFFKLACDVPLENMLKLGQLALVRQLERHGAPAAPKNYGEVFFATRTPGTKEAGKEERRTHPTHLPWLVRWQERIFPVYSDHSQVLARLSPDSDDGWPWRWEHRQDELWLRHKGAPQGYLVSLFCSVKPEGLNWIELGAGGLGLALISFGLVWLMTHNLMLLGTSSPLWLNRRKLSLGASVTHVVYVSCISERLRVPVRSPIEVLDLSTLEEEVESGRILKRLPAITKRLVIVKGFEHRLEDRGFNWTKLALLEALIGIGGRRVILLSNQDPYLCLAAGLLADAEGDPEREQTEKERWRQLLAHFAVVDLDGRPRDARRLSEKLQRMRKRLLAKAGWGHLERFPWSLHLRACLRVVWEECSADSHLQEIGLELLRDLHLGKTSRGELLQEILSRAEGYYAVLWNSISEDEKLVLLQLAEEGLTNPRDLRPLQRLIARGLVRRDPAPRLMNETFRLFVFVAAARDDVHQIEVKREQESTWGQLKAPLTATLLGGILFFGVTQQEVLKTTLSVMTVLAGLLPHVLQLVAYLGSKTPLPPMR